ncbi:MAG: deoxyribodipyrimidine photolyase [Polyangiaceae bacterium]
MSYHQSRLRRANEKGILREGEYVLYWMQAFRRLSRNHALDYACTCARELKKPLVVYEGLRYDYPWASERHHRFILEGMRDNKAEAARLGVNYWPFVATEGETGRGLLRRLSEKACLVVTDDWPCFIVPGQIEALARKSERAVFAVDSCSVVPLSLLGAPVGAAAHLRPRIHKAFAAAFGHRARAEAAFPEQGKRGPEAPFAVWDGDVLGALAKVPVDRSVKAVAGVTGGVVAGRERLSEFVTGRLGRYADERSKPASPEEGAASGLSAYLHYGHVSIEEVVERVLVERYGTAEIELGKSGKRDGFYGGDPNVNGFLDEAITWRDVGHQWLWSRRGDEESLARALPGWAMGTLAKHAGDKRAYLYSSEEWEAGATHDRLWNAAQRELVETGTIHNYLRMLWGKKVLEWSASPEEAYRTVVHLNNKYALDGRDPNSYTGMLWCFGLFDRPWAPERATMGTIRYMSSDNTAKKFKVEGYLRYVAGLGSKAG